MVTVFPALDGTRGREGRGGAGNRGGRSREAGRIRVSKRRVPGAPARLGDRVCPVVAAGVIPAITTELPVENGFDPTVIVTVVLTSVAFVMVTGVAAPPTVSAADAATEATVTVPLVV